MMPGTVWGIIRTTLEDAPDVGITLFVMLIKLHSLAKAAARNSGGFLHFVLISSRLISRMCLYMCNIYIIT